MRSMNKMSADDETIRMSKLLAILCYLLVGNALGFL